MSERITRTRRSCLAVPASNPKMLEKAQGLAVDEVFFDLEDAVAPDKKDEARANAVEWLNKGDWTGKTMVVRINGVQTDWCYQDIIDLVSGAGDKLDCIMIPKPECAHHVQFVEDLVRMVENKHGISKPIGFELIIEAASALTYINEIAAASERTETLIFGYADMSASLGLPAISPGMPMPDYPGDHLHGGLFTTLVAARTFGLQAIDGPFTVIQDIDGLRERALKSKGLGYEGKWALHPGQIEVLNEVFTPTQEEYDKAEAVIEKYEKAKAEGLGAVMFMKDMLDEAVLKQANVVTGRGRASGLSRQKSLADFEAQYAADVAAKAGTK